MLLTHGPYTAHVEYSAEDGVFFSQLNDIPDLVSFEGRTVEELEAAFVEAIEDYLEIRASISEKS